MDKIKKMKIQKIIIHFSLIFSLVFIFLILDNYLYYYGRGKGYFAQKLPFGFVPEYLDYDLGYDYLVAIENKVGVRMLNPGDKYNIGNKTVIIQKIISYAFNKKIFLAHIKDVNKKNYLVEIVPQNKNKLESRYSYALFPFDRDKMLNLKRINVEKPYEATYLIVLVSNSLKIMLIIELIYLVRLIILYRRI